MAYALVIGLVASSPELLWAIAVDPRLQNASTTKRPKPLFDLEESIITTSKEQPFLETLWLWEQAAIYSWMYGQNNVQSID